MKTSNTLLLKDRKGWLPIIVGLLMISAGIAYGIVRITSTDTPPEPGSAVEITRAEEQERTDPQAGADPSESAALPQASEAARPLSGGAPADGKAQPAKPETVTIKMDPLIANLDEGEQFRYLKVSIQLVVSGEAESKVREALPRARHEALMYLSGLHLSDTQGLLGKQRIHRELQRRIADALGGGLKRIYFDEFVVQ